LEAQEGKDGCLKSEGGARGKEGKVRTLVLGGRRGKNFIPLLSWETITRRTTSDLTEGNRLLLKINSERGGAVWADRRRVESTIYP